MKTKIAFLFTILITFTLSVFSQNAWDGYRKKLSDENKSITFSSIYGLDGKIYSAPADAKVSQGEIKAIQDIFNNPGTAIHKDIFINKVKYNVVKADKSFILGTAGTKTFEIMKTKRVILVAVG